MFLSGRYFTSKIIRDFRTFFKAKPCQSYTLMNFTKAIFYLWGSCWSFVSMLEKVFYTHIPRHNSPQNGDHFDFVATQYHSHPIFPRQELFYNVDQDYWKQIRIEYSWSSHNFGLKTKQNIINSLVKEIHFMWISLAWIFKRFPFSFNTYYET